MRTSTTPTNRVIGIVRVSEVGDRDDDALHSPDIQADRIREACGRDGLTLLDTLHEIDVSGGKPLSKRAGLRSAIEAVEAGRADMIVVAYFDRLVRSLKVQQEIVERVENAGGEVLTLDVGRITNGTAVQRLTSNFLGSVNTFFREQGAEKSGEGQRRAVALGKWIGPVPCPGYVKAPDGRLALDSTAPVARDAFALRAGGATYREVQAFLDGHGIHRTVSGVRAMLRSRAYVGEINFGQLTNMEAHPAIVEPALFARVQRTRVSAGRKAKSDRLLARIGILRCAVCDGRMSASSSGQGYPCYRCTSEECGRPQTMGAVLVEQVVAAAVKVAIANVEGRASAAESHQEAAGALERAQADLDAAFRAFAGYEAETAARERLAELRQARDEAQAHVDQLGGVRVAITVTGADWDRLTLDEQQDLIRATVERVTVGPGRGADRITVELLGQ